ncbi:MAG: hypothetical protein AAGA25_17475 [Planctomycetota bacterium]
MNPPIVYYVRLARTVEGPLSREEIKHRFELNLLSTYHEVSSDQQEWQPLDISILSDAGSLLEAIDRKDQASLNEENDAEWMDHLDRLSTSERSNAQSHIKPQPFARLSHSLMLSAGMLLLLSTNLPLPRSNGSYGGWWLLDEPFSWTLSIWMLAGLSVFISAFAPNRFEKSKLLLALALVGWLSGLMLILGDDDALRMMGVVWWVAIPPIAWCASVAVAKRAGNKQDWHALNGLPQYGLRATIIAVGLAWLAAAVHTLIYSSLPIGWLVFFTATLSPAALLVFEIYRSPTTKLIINRPIPEGLLLLGFLLSSVVLGIQQNIAHDAAHHLSQLVTVGVGMIALAGCVVAAVLESTSDT